LRDATNASQSSPRGYGWVTGSPASSRASRSRCSHACPRSANARSQRFPTSVGPPGPPPRRSWELSRPGRARARAPRSRSAPTLAATGPGWTRRRDPADDQKWLVRSRVRTVDALPLRRLALHARGSTLVGAVACKPFRSPSGTRSGGISTPGFFGPYTKATVRSHPLPRPADSPPHHLQPARRRARPAWRARAPVHLRPPHHAPCGTLPTRQRRGLRHHGCARARQRRPSIERRTTHAVEHARPSCGAAARESAAIRGHRACSTRIRERDRTDGGEHLSCAVARPPDAAIRAPASARLHACRHPPWVELREEDVV
jgi:hypothetical protein